MYLAEDTRLHRKVALKILPSDLASDRNRMDRFNQEAMAAAALNHPHIAHIYEIGEADWLPSCRVGFSVEVGIRFALEVWKFLTNLERRLAGGFELSPHTATWAVALLLMLAQASWATGVLLHRNERAILTFHRVSILVWTVWLLPFVTGMVLALSRGR